MHELNKTDVALSVTKASFASWISKFGSIASAILILRFIDPAQYGVWRFVMASVYFVLGWVGSPFSLVVTEAIHDSVAEEKGGAQRYQGRLALRGYLRLSVTVAVLLGGVAMLFADALAQMMYLPTPWIVRLAGLLLIMNGLRTVASAWILVTVRFGQHVRIQFVESIAYPVMIGLLLVGGISGWLAVALGAVLAGFAALAVSVPLLLEANRQLPRAGVREETKALYQIFRDHGKWAMANDMLKDALDAGRVWLVRHLFGDAIVGIYGLADSLYGHITSLVSATQVYASSLPRIMTDQKKMREFVVDMVKFGTAAYGMFVVLSWFAMPVFSTLFPKYQAAIPLYMLMSITLFNGGLATFLNAYYPIKRWQRPLFFMSVLRTTASFLLLVLLAPLGAVYALAGEMVLTGYLFSGMRYLYLRSRQPDMALTWHELMLGREDRQRFRQQVFRQVSWFSRRLFR